MNQEKYGFILLKKGMGQSSHSEIRPLKKLFSEKVGQGLQLWLPKGKELKERLMDFLKKAQTDSGYLPVSTPHIGHKDLYVCSGHYDKYGKIRFNP